MNNVCSINKCKFIYTNSDELYEHCKIKHTHYSICGRCLDGHGYIEIISIDELYENEYYEYVCEECHGYLLDNE